MNISAPVLAFDRLRSLVLFALACVAVSSASAADAPKPFPDFSAPRAVTGGPHDHFLANYFAINAWSPDNRYLLTLETDLKDKLPDGAPATLGLVDLEDGNRFIPVTTTRCWNFQEAAMAHWLPWAKDTFVFNDLRDGKFSAVVLNWKTKEERVLPGLPVSAVSEDGEWAISINYARLFLTRPDYGYAGNGQDPRKGVVFPEDDGLWRVNLRTGEAKLIVSTAAVRDLVPKVGPTGMSYLCHTVISKDFKRIYFLSRSVEESMEGVKKFKGVNWFTTAFTCHADGSNLRRCFPDGWGSSHFNWKPNLSEKDAATMVVTCKWLDQVYTHVEFTVGDEKHPRQVGGAAMDFDGHCIYSPDGAFVSGDGYWDKAFTRHWKIVRLADMEVRKIGDFFVPEPYRDIYCRCDLHPRWRPDGRQIGFNSVHEGSRQVYVMDVKGVEAPAPRPAPRPALAARLADDSCETYGILHFGLNTFTDREWGYGDEDPKLFDPKAFDADQIAGAAKAGGLGGLIVVAKHHDGFCLWPTKTTTHNIAASPFRGGKGDYVREMSDACRRAGIRFGVYVSPWDRNNAAYGTPAYVDIFHAQIKELLGGDYGEVFEMWFDGANGGDGYYGGARERRKIPSGYYRFDEVFAFVRRLQPGVSIFNESDAADFRWPCNERGILDGDSRATVRAYDPKTYMSYGNVGDVDGTTFHPCEADFPMRPGWFYHDKERGRTKNAAYLMQRYLSTVGNGGTMNLGLSPNRDGVIDDEDVKALAGFKAIKDAFFAHPCQGEEPCNAVVMTEDVSRGEFVDGWRLVASGVTLATGRSVGVKRIRILDEPVRADLVRLDWSHRLPVPNGHFVRTKCYNVSPELLNLVRSATAEGGETDTAKWMTGAAKESK